MNIEAIVTLIVAIFGSTGFWSFLSSRRERKYRQSERQNEVARGTMALLHSQIYQLARDVIKRGGITASELDDLESLYAPYSALGGNNTGTTYYQRAKTLPLINDSEVK